VLATGRTIQEAMQLTQREVLAGIGGLPKDHEHCALLAATTVPLLSGQKSRNDNCLPIR
jgi:hypothetical protein